MTDFFSYRGRQINHIGSTAAGGKVTIAIAHGYDCKTALLQVRVDPMLKAQAKAFASEHSTNLSELVRVGLAHAIGVGTAPLKYGLEDEVRG